MNKRKAKVNKNRKKIRTRNKKKKKIKTRGKTVKRRNKRTNRRSIKRKNTMIINKRMTGGSVDTIIGGFSSLFDKLVQYLPPNFRDYLNSIRNLSNIVNVINKSSGIEVLKVGKSDEEYLGYKAFYNILLILVNRSLNDIEIYILACSSIPGSLGKKSGEILTSIKDFLLDLRKRIIKMGTDQELYGSDFDNSVSSKGQVVDRVVNRDDILFFSGFETKELLKMCLQFITHKSFKNKVNHGNIAAELNKAYKKLGIPPPSSISPPQIVASEVVSPLGKNKEISSGSKETAVNNIPPGWRKHESTKHPGKYYYAKDGYGSVWVEQNINDTIRKINEKENI